MNTHNLIFCLALIALLLQCHRYESDSEASLQPVIGKITTERLINADKTPGDWLSEAEIQNIKYYILAEAKSKKEQLVE